MTKKQMGIIFTLLALIVCTALLAGKLNKQGLNDQTELSTLLTEDNLDKDSESGDQETLSTQDFFYSSRSEREQNEATTVQNLNELINNANTSAERKEDASKELQKLILKQDKQKSVELSIKNSGYDDAICEIAEDLSFVNIILKADALDENQGANIQEIVQNASNIKEVKIELKK
ncbi:MAG: SpoIIIAH-like family protein [Clostridiales bacterium]|nr:SpoIIIAH-like family protein [Clostridiales bacterium]